MNIEKITREEFDEIDSLVKKEFNGTISEKFALDSIGDWYREIDVSEDLQMLFLRTGSQAMPIRFDQIESVESITIPYNTRGPVRETDNHLGLTALGALCGWFVLAQTTKTKIKDQVVDLHVVKINLVNHPTEKSALYLCSSFNETLNVRIKMHTFVDKYEHNVDGVKPNHNIVPEKQSSTVSMIGVFFIFISPICGLIFSSWPLFFCLIVFGFVLFLGGGIAGLPNKTK